MIKCLSPLKTEQVPIFDSDRDLPEGLLEIKLDKEGAGPCLYEVTNSAGECFVENRGFRVRDSIVDGRASRPRKVVYAPVTIFPLILSPPSYSTPMTSSV